MDEVKKFMQRLEFNESLADAAIGFNQLGKVLKMYYDTMISQGFSESQALELTVKYQGILMSSISETNQ